MAKPVLNNVTTFDATQDKVFTFTYVGVITSIHIKIYNNETGALVYSRAYTRNAKSFTLSANTLTNTTDSYYITIYVGRRITNDDGTISTSYSAESSPVVFYCREPASFYFKDMNTLTPNIIESSSHAFQLVYEYDPEKNEELSYYDVYLYDENEALVSAAERYYNNTGTPHVISNMENYAEYYLQAVAVTKYGMEISTELIPLLVHYSEATAFSYLTLTNQYHDGSIVVDSHPIDVEGEASFSPVEYLDAGGVVVPAGETIQFKDGYYFPANYVLSFITDAPSVTDGSIVLHGENSDVIIGLAKRTFTEGEYAGGTYIFAYLHLIHHLYDSLSHSTTSNFLDYETYSGSKICIWVKKFNGIIDVAIRPMD